MKRLLTSARVLAVYLIIFTQMLDTSVANLALNNIASDLYLDVYYSGWIMTSFGAGLVISFSLGGILAKRYSGDTILAIGSLAFIAASLGCGMSSGAMPFLAFRFLQGLSSGAVIIVAQSRLFQLLGEQQR